MGNKRRKKGEGYWRVTPSGNIEYRFTYKDEFGCSKSKSVTGVSEEHCLERAEQFLYKQEQKLYGIDYDTTIPKILREKVENDYNKNFTNIQGYERNLSTIDAIENSVIGHMPIVDIKVYHMEQYLQSLTKYSNTTIGKFYTMLRSAYSIAYDKKIIQMNLMKNITLRCPKSSKPTKRVKGFTDEEQSRFVKALNNFKPQNNRNTYRLQLLIELYSGMRMGEINALKPADINFSKGFIHVERTISQGGGKSYIKDGTKTPAGVRDVPISAPLRPVLEEALAEMRDNPYGLIFYDYIKGGVFTTKQVGDMFRSLCKRAGLPYYGQHSLRHTFATRCIEAGVPAIVLKGWLGHTNIHITLDTYADVFERMNLGAISKYEEYMKTLMENN